MYSHSPNTCLCCCLHSGCRARDSDAFPKLCISTGGLWKFDHLMFSHIICKLKRSLKRDWSISSKLFLNKYHFCSFWKHSNFLKYLNSRFEICKKFNYLDMSHRISYIINTFLYQQPRLSGKKFYKINSLFYVPWIKIIDSNMYVNICI